MSTPLPPKRRTEVQGLRALAVLMVVIYHVWLGRVSGGVDIFLLISAFLLTLSFVRRTEEVRPLNLPRYWLSLGKRLLPGVVIVLLAILVATALVIPRARWADIFSQTWASLLYFQNWELAGNAVDYYAADDSTASPLQHFWSLSIQGQVFVLWPLIFAVAAVTARKLGLRLRPLLAVVFGLIFTASLTYSIWQTATNQSYAYFDTRTRLWEFAFGSLLALALPYLNFSRAVRIVLGWVGVAAMISCGLVLQVQQQFPGYIALWPLLAAACVIVAGQTQSRFGVDRVLSATPLVKLGDNSYALYLWHWPLLVTYLIASDREGAGLLDGAVIIAASLVLAVITTRVVERPVRAWTWPERRRRHLGLVLAASMALVAVPLSGWEIRVNAEEQAAEQQSPADNPGAASLDPGFTFAGNPDALMKPFTSRLDGEWAQVDGECRPEYAPASSAVESCLEIGDPIGAEKTVVVLGDSHAQQWLAALGPVARSNNWFVVALLKPACRYGAAVENRPADCNAHNAAAREYVLEQRPDAVFTVASVTAKGSPNEVLADGYVAGLRDFGRAGIGVVGIRDNPRFSFNMAECIDRNGAGSPVCDRPRGEVMAAASPMQALPAAARRAGIRMGVMDLTDYLCGPEVCPGVIGNVLAYIDHDHLGRTYVETMAPVFEKRFKAALGWR